MRPRLGEASLYTSAGRRKYLTGDERTRFIAAARASPRPEVRTLCLILAYSGCRLSEALGLSAGSVDGESGFVVLQTLKRRLGRVVFREVPVPESLLVDLQRTHGLGSASPETRLWPFCRSRAWQLVKDVMRQAGIPKGPHMTPKGLRHGFGIHAIQSGVPLNFVQRWLGHARMETTAIYLQAVGSEERGIAARMWKY
jgi:integrase